LDRAEIVTDATPFWIIGLIGAFHPVLIAFDRLYSRDQVKTRESHLPMKTVVSLTARQLAIVAPKDDL
jgi:hypothetical protein